MKKIRSFLQHEANSLHVFCRLRPLLGKRTAITLSKEWERCFLYHVLYPRFGEEVNPYL
jgi:hypothetical protein